MFTALNIANADKIPNVKSIFDGNVYFKEGVIADEFGTTKPFKITPIYGLSCYAIYKLCHMKENRKYKRLKVFL